MPLDVLEPHSQLSVRYNPIRGNPIVNIYVEASPGTRVDVYVLTPAGMREFDRGEDFEYYEHSMNRRVHEFVVELDQGQPWYLLIDNAHAHGTHVYYDVSW